MRAEKQKSSDFTSFCHHCFFVLITSQLKLYHCFLFTFFTLFWKNSILKKYVCSEIVFFHISRTFLFSLFWPIHLYDPSEFTMKPMVQITTSMQRNYIKQKVLFVHWLEMTLGSTWWDAKLKSFPPAEVSNGEFSQAWLRLHWSYFNCTTAAAVLPHWRKKLKSNQGECAGVEKSGRVGVCGSSLEDRVPLCMAQCFYRNTAAWLSSACARISPLSAQTHTHSLSQTHFCLSLFHTPTGSCLQPNLIDNVPSKTAPPGNNK